MTGFSMGDHPQLRAGGQDTKGQIESAKRDLCHGVAIRGAGSARARAPHLRALVSSDS
jgi:hypothetical protein